MSATTLQILPVPPATSAQFSQAYPRSTVFLPKEHGSWSLALEPLLLGLLVAPSLAGGAFAATVLAGFFARRPLKAAFRQEASDYRLTARWTLLMLTVLACTGLVEAAILGGWQDLWPLLIAAPLGGLFVWFDAQNNARATAAELAGSAAFALVPAVIVLLGGGARSLAMTLTVFVLVRSIPTVMTVRCFLRATKGEAVQPRSTHLASWFGLFVVLSLVAGGYAPAIAAIFALILVLRTSWYLGPRRPAWPARRIGQGEAVLGLLYVTLIALGYR